MTDTAVKETIFQPRQLWHPLSKIWEDLQKTPLKKETMSAVIPKPPLKGLLRRASLKIFGIACAFGAVNCTLWQIFWVVPRQKREKEFFKNYDVEKENERLVRLGYLHSKGSSKK